MSLYAMFLSWGCLEVSCQKTYRPFVLRLCIEPATFPFPGERLDQLRYICSSRETKPLWIPAISTNPDSCFCGAPTHNVHALSSLLSYFIFSIRYIYISIYIYIYIACLFLEILILVFYCYCTFAHSYICYHFFILFLFFSFFFRLT